MLPWQLPAPGVESEDYSLPRKCPRWVAITLRLYKQGLFLYPAHSQTLEDPSQRVSPHPHFPLPRYTLRAIPNANEGFHSDGNQTKSILGGQFVQVIMSSGQSLALGAFWICLGSEKEAAGLIYVITKEPSSSMRGMLYKCWEQVGACEIEWGRGTLVHSRTTAYFISQTGTYLRVERELSDILVTHGHLN